MPQLQHHVSVKAKKARSSGADDFVIMFFEIGFEVLLEGASKTLEATGDVVSGVAEGVGDVAGGLADGLS